MSDHASREVERRGSETGEMASERVMLCAITRVPLSNAKCCVCVCACVCVCVCVCACVCARVLVIKRRDLNKEVSKMKRINQ